MFKNPFKNVKYLFTKTHFKDQDTPQKLMSVKRSLFALRFLQVIPPK